MNMANNDDVAAARRAALAAALQKGETVVVTPSGQVGTSQEAQSQGLSGIEVPEGKLA